MNEDEDDSEDSLLELSTLNLSLAEDSYLFDLDYRNCKDLEYEFIRQDVARCFKELNQIKIKLENSSNPPLNVFSSTLSKRN